MGFINKNTGVNTVEYAQPLYSSYTIWTFFTDFFLDNLIRVLHGILLLVAITVMVTTNILKKKMMMMMVEQTLGMMMTVI